MLSSKIFRKSCPHDLVIKEEIRITMKKGFKRYIGDKAFYGMVLAVVVPIMVQNGITNFVSLLDNIMVGRVGTEPMSGVAIVNQLIFVFNRRVVRRGYFWRAVFWLRQTGWRQAHLPL